MADVEISNYHGFYRDLHTPAIIVGGSFAVISVAFSLGLIFQHLRSYTNPSEQKWIIGILFMVPIYATESVISLSSPRFSLVCDILRNCYEAFAVYCFGSYLVACLGGESIVVELLQREAGNELDEELLKKRDETANENVLREFFCHPKSLGEEFYTIVKFGLVQYMILKTFCAFLSLLLELFGLYGDGEFKWHYGYPYIAFVLNFSQMWALYCLVQFYNVTQQRLQDIKPLSKFISFKAIVFATWWQGVAIALICYVGVLPKEGKIQNGIQDFLICIEMAVAAIAHIFVFSAEPYRFIPSSEYGKITTRETNVKVRDKSGKGPALLQEIETNVEAPGTSVTESVQDVVLGGGETVVKDVALTISQAMEPVEKGVGKIQETFHHISVGTRKEEEEEEEQEPDSVEVEEHVTEKVEGDGEPTMIMEEKEVIVGKTSEVDDSFSS